jgi:nucleotide-binding universal stress UspA family protein
MSDNTRSVVVGVDGTEAALGAARWAAAVAHRFAAPLHIVHAMPDAGHLLSDAAAAARASFITEQRASAKSILKSVEDAVRAEFGTLTITTTHFDESADKVLTELSRRAHLIVLGCADVSPGAALLLGSTTVAVTTHSSCPVVAWRGGIVTPTGQPIVLGVDGERTGAAAFRTAFEFADRLGVTLNAVNAWPTRHFPGDFGIPYLVDWDALESAQWSYLLNAVEPWSKEYPSVEVTYFVEPHGNSQALLRHVTDSQLVVVGNRGRNLLTGALLGSTSLNMLHHSPVPVMVCHVNPHDGLDRRSTA